VATVIAFHAHPDDEVLLTGGTLARLAAEGHRVVIAVATDGVIGPADGPDGRTRLDELQESAAALGAARVVHLGYADSGHGPLLYADPPDRERFARADVAEAAGRLADLIRAEHAEVLLSYDPRGGYGHRDHVKVHLVGAVAAELTGVRVLEATLPRELAGLLSDPLRLLWHIVRRQRGEPPTAYTPRAVITHRITVRQYARQKQAALAAHRSLARAGSRTALLARAVLALPVPVFGIFAGREWFVEPGAPSTTRERAIL
jgi:LmbE family N-acetylglucosaminyl deacetylase